MNDIKLIEKQIEELQVKLEAAKKEDAAIQKMSTAHRLAIDLHEILCRHNHTDGCGWYYLKDTDETAWNEGGDRYHWLHTARLILNYMHVKNALHNCKDDIQFVSELAQLLRRV